MADRIIRATDRGECANRPAGGRPSAQAESAPAPGFNLMEVENMARAMVQKARSRVEELTLRRAALEEEFRERREELIADEDRRRTRTEEELADLRRRTEAELDALRKEVEETARTEASEQGFQEGLLRGREEGLHAGREEGRAQALEETRARLGEELEEAITSLTRVASELASRTAALLRGAERDVIDLALAVAAKIVKCEIRTRPEVVLGNVRKALEIIAQRSGATVEVNPDDLRYVEEHAGRGLDVFRESPTVRVEANPHVERGGCLVTSSGGGADLQITTQLELVEQVLLGEESGEAVPAGTGPLDQA